LLFYIFLTVANFSDFDEALCKLSSFEVESYRKTYTLKTSILGKVTAMWLQEREEVINKMSIEPKKLKREFNLAQAANIDLEKKVVDLVDALKKCELAVGLGSSSPLLLLLLLRRAEAEWSAEDSPWRLGLGLP
jgi:hypothetical protein